MNLAELDIWQSLLRAIPVAGLVLLSAFFLGHVALLTLREVNHNSRRPTVTWIEFHLAVILGINLLGWLVLLSSSLPASIRSFLFLALGVGSTLWAIRQTRIQMQAVGSQGRQMPWIHMQSWLIALPLLFTLGPALAYPSGWDELTYHLELPRRWYASGSYAVYSDLPYSALPSLLEAVFSLTYPIESLITPRLIVWVLWVHGIFIFYHAMTRVCQPANALTLTVAFATSPMALMISANCYVETLIWANTAAIAWLLLPTGPESPSALPWRQAALMGLFIGGCIAIKMTSVGLICLPLIMVALGLRLTWRPACLVILCGLAFAAPFYLRTWVQTGNPVAPFYAQWFTSDPAWILCSDYHHDLATGSFGMHGAAGLLVSPVGLAMAYELYDGTLGWQWLSMLFLLTVASVRALKRSHPHRSFLQLCVIATILFYALWFLTSQQVRFAIPLLIVVTLAAGLGIETYRMQVQRYWRVAIIGLSLVSAPWNNFGYYLDSWLCVLKVRTPLDYIRDGVSDSYADLAISLQEQVPSDARIACLFEHRLTYLPYGTEIATPYFQTKYFRNPAAETPDSFLEELRSQGISHVVLTTNPLGPDVSRKYIESQQQWFQCVDECIASGQLKIVWKSEQHALAEVQSARSAAMNQASH